MKLYDAPRCPYCARARIALAEKGIAYDTVEVDLANRPLWLFELNPVGRVPVLEHDELVLPESDVIMAYLEELRPEPALLPAGLAERAQARLLVRRFEENLGTAYYRFRRGEENDLPEKLATLEVEQSLYADIAYVPWVIRLRELFGVELPRRLDDWLEVACDRPSVAAELELVRSL